MRGAAGRKRVRHRGLWRALLSAAALMAMLQGAGARGRGEAPGNSVVPAQSGSGEDVMSSEGREGSAYAVLGGGCFWCTEAVFERIDGVRSVVSGYAGGSTVDPTYEQVCTGRTGHAEVIRIEYDPSVASYAELLEVFWKAHDPTTVNQQGADVGTQYRSIILTGTEEQRQIAERSRREADASGRWPRPIVTEIVPLKEFYPAEGYHQDYFARNPQAAYCAFVIQPKLKKLGFD